MLGMAALPSFLQRAVAGTAAPNKKKMVVLFQRGAMDGLNVVVPFARTELLPHAPDHRDSRADAVAAPKRRSIWTVSSACIRASHPMVPLFQSGQLAIVQAVGSPDPTRSHFDAQDFMESGTPGRKATDDGWLNRALQTMPEEQSSPFRAVAFGPYLPRTLQGSRFRSCDSGPEAIQNVRAAADHRRRIRSDVRANGGSARCAASAQETFEAIDQLKKINPDTYQPENGAQYPKGRFGQSLHGNRGAVQGGRRPGSCVSR